MLPKTVSESIYTDVTSRSANNRSPYKRKTGNAVTYEPVTKHDDTQDESYVRLLELQRKLDITAKELNNIVPERNLQEYLYPV